MTMESTVRRQLPKRRTAPDGPRKSALRRPGGNDAGLAAVVPHAAFISDPVEVRARQRELYGAHLNVTPSKRGKPMSAETIKAYGEAVRSLNIYLISINYPGGFETVDHVVLNAYLQWYRTSNTQGGTVTKQGNLRPFFEWISDEYQVRNGWDHKDRHVYRRDVEPPALLSNEFIDDLLKATSGRDFINLRDNAIVRMFLMGPRNCEVQALAVDDLDLRAKVAMLSAFKGGIKRPIPIAPQTAIVLARYLRARADLSCRPNPTAGELWLSAKGGTPLTKSGIYQMLKRRSENAGYSRDDVHPHLFRHTAAHEWLDEGGSEGDAMALFGWKDRSMLDRYGASLKQQRAVDAATRRGFGDRKVSS